MNFATRELNVIGGRSINSRMNERYDRSVCASELLLRNAVIQKMVSGRNMVESFHLPESVTGAERIGGSGTPPANIAELSRPQVESPLVPRTQDLSAPVHTPTEVLVDEQECDTKPCDPKDHTP